METKEGGMSNNIRFEGLGGPPENLDIVFRRKNEEKNVSEKIKEENIRAEVEKELKRKEEQEMIKKSIMSEDDLKVLLLMFGSRGSATLLEKVVEKKKKDQQLG